MAKVRNMSRILLYPLTRIIGGGWMLWEDNVYLKWEDGYRLYW